MDAEWTFRDGLDILDKIKITCCCENSNFRSTVLL